MSNIKVIPLFVIVLCIATKVMAQQKKNCSVYYEKFLEEEKIETFAGIDQLLNRNSAYIININHQDDFDQIQSKIEEALELNNKEIVVEFDQGPFFYKEMQIDINKINQKEVSLKLHGNKTKIISKGKQYHVGEKYDDVFSVYNVYLDNDLKDIFIWSQMYQADGLVDIIDEQKKLCCIHSSEIQLDGDMNLANAWLQLTEWYVSGIYKIEKIVDQSIYFTAFDLKPGMAPYGNYNVNYDYTVVNKLPRFRVCNVGDKTSTINIARGQIVKHDFYECNNSTFLNICETELKSLEISGIYFYGNTGVSPLFLLKNSNINKGIIIHDCNFYGIKSAAVYLFHTSNACITQCRFEDCYDYAFIAQSDVKNMTITDNYFFNLGKGLKNTFAILCQSNDYYIAHNEIINYGCSGIGVGVDITETVEGNGIVEDNVLLFTDDYAEKMPKNSLIDAGAIYVCTKNVGTIIRYNRIHNYTGAHSNRGIYCDDGAYGFSIYGNVITGISNSNYIDSRLNPLQDLPNNTNNVVMYNIIGGGYKFEGSTSANNGCIKGENIVLYKKGDLPYEIIINNVINPENDTFLEYKGNRGLKIVVPHSTSKELRKLPFYKRIKKYFTAK